MVRPAGIEPAHPVPETGALSPELRAHISDKRYCIIIYDLCLLKFNIFICRLLRYFCDAAVLQFGQFFHSRFNS